MADTNSRTGTTYASGELLHYVNSIHVPHDEALDQAFRASELHDIPPIQVGPAEGKLIGLLMTLIRAQKVVEIGTLAGYSTIHLARGLSEGGHLWSLELNETHASIARQNLQRAGQSQNVTVLEGAALDGLPSLKTHAPFDAVFIDADKGNYHHYTQWAVEVLRPGGLFIADNAFYFGHLQSDSPEAAAMRKCHALAHEHFASVCVPTPDGLIVGIRR